MTVEKFKRAEKIMEEMNRWEEITRIINNNPCEIAVEVICCKVEKALDILKVEFESL